MPKQVIKPKDSPIDSCGSDYTERAGGAIDKIIEKRDPASKKVDAETIADGFISSFLTHKKKK